MPDPAGGSYGRDAAGKLNGMQYGKAAQVTSAIVPEPTMAVKLIAARGVEAQMNAFGITSIHDIARLDAISQLQTYTVDIERSYSDVDSSAPKGGDVDADFLSIRLHSGGGP